MVAANEARLQLADPIPALGQRQSWVICQTVFAEAFIEPLFVKRAECWRQAAESPDQPDLGADAVNGETEPHFQRKRETTLGFALHLIEWIARREKVCVQVG